MKPRLIALACTLISFNFLGAAENSAAASRALEKSIALIASGDWSAASFEAKLGETYAPSWADFPYLESMAALASGKTRAEAIALVERSIPATLFWRSYNRADALRLAASLYADTLRFADSLRALDEAGPQPSPDSDLTRLRCYYGLGRVSEARTLMIAALDRWPYDARFPRLFLLREQKLKPDGRAIAAADTVLSRLYIWDDEDRELLLLSVPFIHDETTRIRNLREFRAMGSSDRQPSPRPSLLSTLRALEYGLISEEAALDEALDPALPIDFEILGNIIRLCGSDASRKRIAAFLDSFEGTITLDRNQDGITDSRAAYRMGRPILAEIDPDQDGLINFSVDCDFGEPIHMVLSGGDRIVYDTYPSVRQIARDREEWELRPLSLQWKPVDWIPHDFDLDGKVFYTLEPTGTEPPLTARLLEANAFRLVRPSAEVSGGTERILWRNGEPVSSETRLGGQLYSWTSWTAGKPALVRIDRDGDGYLETTRVNDAEGAARSVAVDRDGDSRPDYREEYGRDGSSKIAWDTDENGIDEIVRTVDPQGLERVEWLHPMTSLPVSLTIERGLPRSVSYRGTMLPILRDPARALWWIGSVPSSSRELAQRVLDRFNRETVPVVVFTLREDGVNLVAVSAGGLFFAELLDQ